MRSSKRSKICVGNIDCESIAYNNIKDQYSRKIICKILVFAFFIQPITVLFILKIVLRIWNSPNPPSSPTSVVLSTYKRIGVLIQLLQLLMSLFNVVVCVMQAWPKHTIFSFTLSVISMTPSFALKTSLAHSVFRLT